MNGQWMLPEDLSAARAAREQVAASLEGRAELDDALIVASELVANAVRHGRPPFELCLEITLDSVLVTVTNHGDHFDPSIVDPAVDADPGRGLAIVRALSQRVGSWLRGDLVGVWARVGPHR